MSKPDSIHLIIDEISQLQFDPRTGVLSISTRPKKNSEAQELILIFHFNQKMTHMLFKELFDAQKVMLKDLEGVALSEAVH